MITAMMASKPTWSASTIGRYGRYGKVMVLRRGSHLRYALVVITAPLADKPIHYMLKWLSQRCGYRHLLATYKQADLGKLKFVNVTRPPLAVWMVGDSDMVVDTIDLPYNGNMLAQDVQVPPGADLYVPVCNSHKPGIGELILVDCEPWRDDSNRVDLGSRQMIAVYNAMSNIGVITGISRCGSYAELYIETGTSNYTILDVVSRAMYTAMRQSHMDYGDVYMQLSSIRTIKPYGELAIVSGGKNDFNVRTAVASSINTYRDYINNRVYASKVGTGNDCAYKHIPSGTNVLLRIR